MVLRMKLTGALKMLLAMSLVNKSGTESVLCTTRGLVLHKSEEPTNYSASLGSELLHFDFGQQ